MPPCKPKLHPMLLPQAPHWGRAEEVALYARACMDVVGLGDWEFRWDKAIRRLGCCKPARRTVSLSIYFVTKYLELNQEQIRRTLLHELAHALAWDYNHTTGHGVTWHAFCEALGVAEEKSHVRCEDFAPAEKRQRKPRYVLCHKETGEVFHYFYSAPSRSAAHLDTMYIRGRKAETLGKLAIYRIPDAD